VHLVVFVLVSTGLYIFLARFTLAFYTLRKKYYHLRKRDLNGACAMCKNWKEGGEAAAAAGGVISMYLFWRKYPFGFVISG
jgi:hypothetical protein